ncbi:MAG: hypothetical protein ACJAY8_001133 [Sphingobacteriales bacterium]|jgi:hypothetical protein
MNKLIVGLGLIVGFVQTGFAQQNSFNQSGNGLGSLFATDYQSLGINPGNLGWNKEMGGSNFAIGFLELDFAVHSTLLDKDALRSLVSTGGDNAFLSTYAEKREAAEKIASSNLRFSVNSRWAGFSFTTKAIGGFGFSLSDHLSMGIHINKAGSDVFFNGALANYFDVKYDENGNQLGSDYNEDDVESGRASNPVMASKLFDGTDIGYMWYRQISLGYGMGVIKTNLLSIYPGIGVNYLMGQGIFRFAAKDGKLSAFNSFNPSFDVDYAGVSSQSQSSGGNLSSVGGGLGVDLGANVVLLDKFRFSMALTGLGSINWKGNALKANDFLVDSTSSKGFDSYNFVKEVAEDVQNGTIKWSDGESERIMTPAFIRLGAGMKLAKILKAGVDFSFPLNDVPGSIDGGTLALGAEVDLKVVKVTTGYTINKDYGNSIPFGISFDLAVYEFGFASRDIASFILADGNTISMSMGFLRFKF